MLDLYRGKEHVGHFYVELVIQEINVKGKTTPKRVCPKDFQSGYRQGALSKLFGKKPNRGPWNYLEFFNITTTVDYEALDATEKNMKIKKFAMKYPLKAKITSEHNINDCLMRFNYVVETASQKWFEYMRNDWRIPVRVKTYVNQTIPKPQYLRQKSVDIDTSRSNDEELLFVRGNDIEQKHILQDISGQRESVRLYRQREAQRKAQEILDDIELDRITQGIKISTKG